jgi:hypothetical protein
MPKMIAIKIQSNFIHQSKIIHLKSRIQPRAHADRFARPRPAARLCHRQQGHPDSAQNYSAAASSFQRLPDGVNYFYFLLRNWPIGNECDQFVDFSYIFEINKKGLKTKILNQNQSSIQYFKCFRFPCFVAVILHHGLLQSANPAAMLVKRTANGQQQKGEDKDKKLQKVGK